MTKIGNFVTREYVKMTEEEIIFIVGKLKECFRTNPYAAYFFNKENADDITAEYLHYTGMTNVFEIKFDNEYKGKGYRNKNRYNGITAIVVCISKCKGELEIDWNTRQYQSFDGHSYNIDIKANGRYVPYKKRKEELIQGCGFDYDTDLKELADRTIYDALTKIVSTLS